MKSDGMIKKHITSTLRWVLLLIASVSCK